MVAGCGKADPSPAAGDDDRPRATARATGTQPEKKPEPKVVEAKLEDIGKAYRANEVRAKKEWAGKRVRVTVKPDAVVIGGKSGLPVVLARSGYGDGTDSDTGIVFGKGREDEAAEIEKGKPVVIEATVVGAVTTGGVSLLRFEDASLVR